MIKVYIETGAHAECVAHIADEWTYMALLPAFEKMAYNQGGILTESVVNDTLEPQPITEVYLVMCVETDAEPWEVDSVPSILHVCTSEQTANRIIKDLELQREYSSTASPYTEYYIKTKTIEL